VLSELQGLQGNALLGAVAQKWANHEVMVRWMQRFFQYLDRFYVEINSLTPLTDQGYKIFRQVIFVPLIQNITGAILENIRKEREEEFVDVDLVKKVIDIFLYLSNDRLSADTLNCKKYLEDELVQATRQFYQKRSQDLLQNASLSEYLHTASKYYHEEKERCDRYLQWEVRKVLLAEFHSQMLQLHQSSLLDRESGIRFLLQQDRFEDLALLFQLYEHHEDQLQPIAAAFKEHIYSVGAALLDQVDLGEDSKDHGRLKELLISS
jgi:cullin 1